MANLSFNLLFNKKDRKGECPIMMVLTFEGVRIRKQIKVKVKPAHWSIAKSRVKPSLKGEPENNFEVFNATLDKYRKKVQDIFNDALLNDIRLTKEYVQNQLDDAFLTLVRSRNFFEVFGEFTEMYLSSKAMRTYKKHNTALNFYKEFESSTKYELRFDTINLDFFDKLQKYAFISRVDDGKKACSDNYFAALVASLKTFLRWADERGLNRFDSYKKFKASERDVDIIYLTFEELMFLNDFVFKEDELTKVRDVYCFGCYTGLRYSDLNTLNSSHIKGKTIIKTIVKTKETMRIHLNDFALDIIKKYDGSPYYPLPKIVEPRFNKLIKDCCKEAGIKQPQTITKYSGGKAKEFTLPKYELITSHTARKTFTTLSIEDNVNLKALKSMTGHKKDASFNKYINITESFQIQELDRTWNKRAREQKQKNG
ncbi:tyrosine-type recombinase/integrase [Rufibacter glacialis]|nr:tyrosine-type recombinase/integrase [Rufibacter glacialis]GGK72060.1 integrase [Rufibacter glacialis]